MKNILPLMFSVVALQAQSVPQHVSWDRTPAAFAGKRVIVELDNVTKVEGDWMSVTDQTFTMKVKKSSRKQATSTGRQILPKSSITSVRVRERRPHHNVLGGVVTYVLTSMSMNVLPDRRTCLVILAASAAVHVAGHLSDGPTREIVLEP